MFSRKNSLGFKGTFTVLISLFLSSRGGFSPRGICYSFRRYLQVDRGTAIPRIRGSYCSCPFSRRASQPPSHPRPRCASPSSDSSTATSKDSSSTTSIAPTSRSSASPIPASRSSRATPSNSISTPSSTTPASTTCCDKTHPQAVLVYTSTYDHRAVVETCARHGIHVMMEKPLAVSYADALAIAQRPSAAKSTSW